MTIDPNNQPETTETVSAVSIGQNLPYIRWALGHADKISDLITDLQDIVLAVGIDAKWAAVKAAGDLVISILADFPRSADSGRLLLHAYSATGVVCTEAEAAELSARFDGTLIKLILANLPAIIAFIQQIIPLFGDPQTNALNLE